MIYIGKWRQRISLLRNILRRIRPCTITFVCPRNQNIGKRSSGSARKRPASVLLRDIQLPMTLKASIEAKQQAEQESLAMSFRLQKERQEAERKRIEAQGIRDFQQIVAQGISAQLLEWKGIEATENLAKSANAKIVVIGNSKGLPLILGQ